MSREDIATAWLWVAQWWGILRQFVHDVARDLKKDFWFLLYQLRWSKPRTLRSIRRSQK